MAWLGPMAPLVSGGTGPSLEGSASKPMVGRSAPRAETAEDGIKFRSAFCSARLWRSGRDEGAGDSSDLPATSSDLKLTSALASAVALVPVSDAAWRANDTANNMTAAYCNVGIFTLAPLF